MRRIDKRKMERSKSREEVQLKKVSNDYKVKCLKFEKKDDQNDSTITCT